MVTCNIGKIQLCLKHAVINTSVFNACIHCHVFYVNIQLPLCRHYANIFLSIRGFYFYLIDLKIWIMWVILVLICKTFGSPTPNLGLYMHLTLKSPV